MKRKTAQRSVPDKIVFLFDVDNTLLDSGQVIADLSQYPADHYVMVDDKLRSLTAVKKLWGRRVTAVFVRQGHYALDPKILAAHPATDLSLERIGALLNYDRQNLCPSC